MELGEFKQRVLPVKDKLYRLGKRMLGNDGDVEDLLQEVFLALWTQKEKLGAYHSIEALAITIARNKCLDLLKSPKYKHNRNSLSAEVIELNDPGRTPFQTLSDKDDRRIMERMLLNLPDQQQRVIRWRDIAGLEFDEIEQLSGLSRSNIRVLLSRGRKALRESYLKVNDHARGI